MNWREIIQRVRHNWMVIAAGAAVLVVMAGATTWWAVSRTPSERSAVHPKVMSARVTASATPSPSKSSAPSPSPHASAPAAKTPAKKTAGVTGLLRGARLYVEPGSEAAAQANSWRASRPADAARMDRIAAAPQAHWLGDWSPQPQGEVNTLVSAAAAAHQLPVMVAYDIPGLDCGGYSAGGAAGGPAYQTWIDQIARGIGSRPAVVILEPDALAELDCFSASQQSSTIQLVQWAVGRLKQGAGTAVYVDAGNSEWEPAGVMAGRLKAAGIAQADGFSLNVSNFVSTSETLGYGNALSALVGGKHFVIDTSRNGNGYNGAWCNPPGRALGVPPTTTTGQALADAYLWIKTPGESDGTCNGGPTAGDWWADYALQLAVNAGY